MTEPPAPTISTADGGIRRTTVLPYTAEHWRNARNLLLVIKERTTKPGYKKV